VRCAGSGGQITGERLAATSSTSPTACDLSSIDQRSADAPAAPQVDFDIVGSLLASAHLYERRLAPL